MAANLDDHGMEKIAMKKSCDICTSSKVKCSGGLPCERCRLKGVECSYSPRKRRSKPKKAKKGDSTSAKSSSSVEIDEEFSKPGEKLHNAEDLSLHPMVMKGLGDANYPLGSSLMEWERRSWSVFFTLYKHYGTSCSLFWFNRQLRKMKNYLARQGNHDSLKRLTAWMTALNIDMDAVTEQISRCQLFIKQNLKPVSIALLVEGELSSDSNNRIIPPLKNTDANVPFVKLESTYPNGYLSDEGSKTMIVVNEAFESIFGISQNQLQQQINWTGGGFLPWGGDVLARLLTREKDVLSFVQIIAIKYNALGKPRGLPCVRDIPSCHLFEVRIKKASNSGSTVPVQALFRILHREVLTADESRLEITLEITPQAPHLHLLQPSSEIQPCRIVSVPKPVMPFATTSPAASQDSDNLDDPDSEFLNSFARGTKRVLEEQKWQLQSLPSFDDMGSMLDPAEATNNNNNSNVIGNSGTIEGFDAEDRNNNNDVDVDASDDVVEGDLFGEQSEWLEGLLDWADKQDLPDTYYKNYNISKDQ